MSMRYASTRARAPAAPCSFADAVLAGLAPDGGLYYPLSLPAIRAPRDANYADLAKLVLGHFAAGSLECAEIDRLVDAAAAQFRQRSWTRLVDLCDKTKVLELFHGPTYSFKDYAMTLVGPILQLLLQKHGLQGNVLVATSGDTGSAAIAGFRGGSTTCTVLMPRGKVSPTQRLQMVTVPDANIRCLEVDGTFDDCQRMLKDCLNDQHFKQKHHLMAVNSVNFARICCQTIYYLWVSLQLDDVWDVVVPTGNFGNILAAYYAKQMGATNLGRLVVAANVNDIMPRVINTGHYEQKEVTPTMSPSIDIQVSSNFERLFRHAAERSVEPEFGTPGEVPPSQFDVEDDILARLQASFDGYSSTEEECLDAIQTVYEKHKYLMDTHTAIAYLAATKHKQKYGWDRRTLIVSTAHPAKFADALRKRLPAEVVDACIPDELARLSSLPQRSEQISANTKHLKRWFDAK